MWRYDERSTLLHGPVYAAFHLIEHPIEGI